MATKGQLIAGGVLAAIAGLAGYSAWKTARRKKRRRPNNCAPYRWDPVPVTASINRFIDDGMDDRNQIATAVANEHFGSYPGGGMVTFPPTGKPVAGVTCVWNRTLELVDAIIAARGFPVKPWEVVEEWTKPDPTPGFMYRADPATGWGISDVAREALKNAGIPNEPNANGVYVNQLAMIRLMECSPYNDAVLSVSGGGGKQGPNGRGISFNAIHADNMNRMMRGEAARRSATGIASHDGTGFHVPYMWTPLLELGAPVPVVANWEDGRSGINPPVEILAFGLENVAPGIYGCEEYGQAASELPL